MQRKKIIIPILDALHLGKTLSRVFMSNDLCPDGIQPYVAVGMIEMPVRVDQVRDGIGAKSGKSFGDLRTRRGPSARVGNACPLPATNGLTSPKSALCH